MMINTFHFLVLRKENQVNFEKLKDTSILLQISHSVNIEGTQMFRLRLY